MHGMLKKKLLVFVVLATCVSLFAADSEVNLVPWPQSLTVTGGEMSLDGSSRIVYSDASLAALAQIVAEEVEEVTRWQLRTTQGTPVAGDIYLAYTADPSITGETYKVTVGTYASAEADNYNAVAMASVTIIQSLKVSFGNWSIPKMTVDDTPDSGYRGFMVDVARQKHSVKSLKELIDMCRLYKVRFMQIHFNDDQAYTLPSKAFPQLNSKSSYSYTLAEVTDLVEYADHRGVILIPEIETPAHASAMCRAMPDLFGDYGGVIRFCDTKVWDAMITIVNEACDMFKSAPYIHLGADEANIWGLPSHPEFQAAIDKYDVGDIEGLFNYYISHLDDAIKARGKKTIVWEGFNYGKTGNAKMDNDVIVMMFDNAKSPQAYIDYGYNVINASWNPMYIVDFKGQGFGMPANWIFQWDKSQFHGMFNYPKSWKRTKFNPLVHSDNVIGAQMCSWEMWDWREIPRTRFRIAPYADRIWNPSNKNDLAHFEKRYESTDSFLDYLLAEHQPPARPADVGASEGLNKDRIRVVWRDGGNYPRQYALYKNTVNDPSTAKLISDRFEKTETVYEDTDVISGKPYYYWVKAQNKWGWSDYSAVAQGKTGTARLAAAYESFNYPVGHDVDGLNGGDGFGSPWKLARSTGPVTIVDGSLYYPGVPSEGNAIKVDCTTEKHMLLSRTFSDDNGLNASDLWMSLMVKGEKVAPGGCLFTLNASPVIGKEPVNGIGIWYDTSVFMETNVTYFAVVYIDCRPGRDYMYLWVNPSVDQQPAIENADAHWELADIGVGNKIEFSISGGGLGKYIIDEIRIGSDFSDAIGVPQLDANAPKPNPVTWKAQPASKSRTSVEMTCATVSHANGVEYFFEEMTGNPGGDDSGWQSDPTYVDTGLKQGCTYTYRVKARNQSSANNQAHGSPPFSITPPNTMIGVNFGTDQHSSAMAGLSFDGLSSWTDASGPNGSGLSVKGSGGAVTCDWTANNTWSAGAKETPKDKLYVGYLDDPGDNATVTFKGLRAWLASISHKNYTVRVYRNTDSGTGFNDVKIISNGLVVDVVKFDGARPGGTHREVNDSNILSADSIVVDPEGNDGRGTISGVQIIAVPDE